MSPSTAGRGARGAGCSPDIKGNGAQHGHVVAGRIDGIGRVGSVVYQRDRPGC